MKTKISLLALALILFAGCRTIKQKESVTSVSKNDVTATSNVKRQTLNNAVSAVNGNRQTVSEAKVADTGTVNEMTEETSKTTLFSTPDSTGKQYPIAETTTKKITRKGEKKNVQAATKTDIKEELAVGLENHSEIKAEYLNEATDKSAQKTTAQINKVAKTKTPLWVTITSALSIIIVLGALIYFVYVILKRYKLIK